METQIEFHSTVEVGAIKSRLPVLRDFLPNLQMESVPHSFDGADFFGNCPYSSALSQEFAFLENFNVEEEYPKKFLFYILRV